MIRHLFKLALCCLLAGCYQAHLLSTNEPGETGALDKALEIYVLDVGQGDATLLIGPDGTTGLIDAGPPEAGLARVLPALQQLEISRLDWVIISHYDADHLGGLLEILQGLDRQWDTADDLIVDHGIWDRGGRKFYSTYWFDDYVTELTRRQLRRTLEVGQTFALGDGAVATVVLSNGFYNDGNVHHLNPDEENAASVALLITYGAFRYLTAGDLTGGGFSGDVETKDLETQLAALVGPVDILHLNHHGSRTSSNANSLDQLSPELAVISVGADNDFGHPHPSVLQRLEERQIPARRSDAGTILIRSDGHSFELAQELNFP